MLIQRFENTISNSNFPGPSNPDERGLIFCDHTENKKLLKLLRQRPRYNPVPSRKGGYRNLPFQYVIEDSSFRNSEHSYFIQAADLTAYLLYQKLNPNSYMKGKGALSYFSRLSGVLCTHASSTDPNGIVRL